MEAVALAAGRGQARPESRSRPGSGPTSHPSPMPGWPAMSDVVGARTPRVGGLDRVTGRQAYVADIPLDDVLHVKLVTLPVAVPASARSTTPPPVPCPASGS